jgi:hypothetical protein
MNNRPSSSIYAQHAVTNFFFFFHLAKNVCLEQQQYINPRKVQLDQNKKNGGGCAC